MPSKKLSRMKGKKVKRWCPLASQAKSLWIQEAGKCSISNTFWTFIHIFPLNSKMFPEIFFLNGFKLSNTQWEDYFFNAFSQYFLPSPFLSYPISSLWKKMDSFISSSSSSFLSPCAQIKMEMEKKDRKWRKWSGDKKQTLPSLPSPLCLFVF